ncbi:ABC transporter ATP-binding protein [Pseudomonas sp. TH03]|uniref:ABC transporter ATP-binding protein n=1 Tax=Pseudomonas sp. TH03 TaxID=2796369 RepID=UPI0019138F04|nr:ABC transporter ATP-binding protein [Pseudomonas sp. TH03]MBK5552223.1 ABC transporter ATP-binding protein [Pseudomonas sp. TH03]
MSSDSDIAIKVENLSKCYQIYDQPHDRLKQFLMSNRQYYREFWALNDVSFEIKKGETVGIIGRNGSGKSTLLQMICGTLNPTSGSVQTYGRIAALLELGSGFNPEFTGRENIYMNAAVLGLSTEETDARYDQIVAFADIGNFIGQAVKTYSSGMMVRLAFSVAIHVDPDILIIDEALSVGDAYFQAKCAKMIQEIIARGSTVLFVSHDTASVKSLCSRALLLESGRSRYLGDVNTAVEKYYSALIESQRTDRGTEEVIVATQAVDAEFNAGVENFQSMATFQRIQNGVAEFVNVTLLNEQGVAIDSVDFGQKVTLRQVVQVNKSVPKLGLAYHIRDKNGQDIIYSDTGIENDSHLLDVQAGSVHVVEWRFIAHLREGSYVVASMLAEPRDLRIGDVEVADFVPISAKFSLSSAGRPQIYAAAYWDNEINVREIKDVSN